MERLHKKEVEELLDSLEAGWQRLSSLIREYEQAVMAWAQLCQKDLELADRVYMQVGELKAADDRGLIEVIREQEKARQHLQALKERHRTLENMIAHMRTALEELDEDGDKPKI